jgi:hypothetical protein
MAELLHEVRRLERDAGLVRGDVQEDALAAPERLGPAGGDRERARLSGDAERRDEDVELAALEGQGVEVARAGAQDVEALGDGVAPRALERPGAARGDAARAARLGELAAGRVDGQQAAEQRDRVVDDALGAPVDPQGRERGEDEDVAKQCVGPGRRRRLAAGDQDGTSRASSSRRNSSGPTYSGFCCSTPPRITIGWVRRMSSATRAPNLALSYVHMTGSR